MPLEQVPAHDSILAQLKTIQGIDVYEGQYITDGSIPKLDVNGLFPPYATTVFGASYEGTSRGIVKEKYNTLRTTVTVYVIAPTDRLTRQYVDKAREALLGFIPTDGSPLKPYGGYDFVDADLGVTRYVHSLVFSYETNMTIVLQ